MIKNVEQPSNRKSTERNRDSFDNRIRPIIVDPLWERQKSIELNFSILQWKVQRKKDLKRDFKNRVDE
jgi:hypothetical protein